MNSRVDLSTLANKCKSKLLKTLIGICWLSSATGAWAERSITLAWDPSPDTNVVGYILYYGTSSGNYAYQIDAGTNTMGTATGLREGTTYFFTVTAYNAQGVESLPAGEISYLVPGLVKIVGRSDPSDPLRLRFPSASGQAQRIQASGDLRNWTTIWEGTNTANDWIEIWDPEAQNLPKRFYRVVTQ